MILFYINLILISVAIIPAIILLVKVYCADRLEPELLISLAPYGIIAIGLGMAAEWAGTLFLDTIAAELPCLSTPAVFYCGRRFRRGIQISPFVKTHLALSSI